VSQKGTGDTFGRLPRGLSAYFCDSRLSANRSCSMIRQTRGEGLKRESKSAGDSVLQR
jgi:hypothetical protein